jgi:outer membrane receptor protein involved in Fe transport
VEPLVRSRGAEAGLRLTPRQGWRSTLSLWTVGLDSELLFVGDAGTTEPSDASRRLGVTWTNFYRVIPALTADLDLSLARARLLGAAPGEALIPGALERVLAAGLTWEPPVSGPFAALRLRHFGSYPLLEDGSERADPATLTNLNIGWALPRGLRLGVGILNLLDVEAADIQYFYASRVHGEPLNGVEDIHFHPVEPRQLRFTATWGF